MSTRQASARAIEKWDVWRFYARVWGIVFWIVGGAQAALAVLVAVNTKQGIWTGSIAWILAVAAAVLSFLVGAFGAQAKAAAFETAARELEKAIVRYETDDSVTEIDLGKAEQRGIDILNRMKSQ
jgi:hypothetical protein